MSHPKEWNEEEDNFDLTLSQRTEELYRIPLAIVLGISDFVHLVLLLPLWGVRRALVQITGLDVA